MPAKLALFLRMLKAAIWPLAILFVLVSMASAQIDPSAGILPFSTQSIGGVDLATSSITQSIPIRSKNGLIPFNYRRIISSHYFKYYDPYAGAWYWEILGRQTDVGPTGLGLMGATFGLNTQTGTECPTLVYSAITIYDSFNTPHPLPTNFSINACSTASLAAVTTTDGSGYTVVIANQENGPWWVYDKSGNYGTFFPNVIYSPPAVYTPDGVIALSNNGAQFTDSVNTSVLSTRIGNYHFDTNDNYSYADASGTTQEYTGTMYGYDFASQFGCAGISEFKSEVSQYINPWLARAITTPTGGVYNIDYDGNGWLGELTFPAGGSVTYGYSGGNNGINCNSGVVPTLTVTINDGKGNVGTWTYVNNNNSASATNFTVTATDPAGNQTVYNFTGEYQTQAKYYQGSTSGTLLKTVVTCYNGNLSNCATWNPSPAPLQITETDVYTTLGSMTQSSRVTKLYDSYGNLTRTTMYDFGATTPALTVDTPTGSYSGGKCNAVGNYVNSLPCWRNAWAGNVGTGTLLSSTTFTYSATGHLVTRSDQVNVSGTATYLTKSYTYNTNGTMNTFTDVNGAVYQYAYNGTGGCNNLLPTSLTVAGLVSSGQWNCNGGVLAKGIDPNNNAVSYGYLTQGGTADPLWRLLSMTDQEGNVTDIAYVGQNAFEAALQNFNGGNSVSDVRTTIDGLGRVIFTQRLQGPGATNYDTSETDYNNLGESYRSTMPYSAAASPSSDNTSAPGVTTTYDALGRVLTATDSDGGKITYKYTNNDVLQTTSGTQTFQKQFEYDGLGRLTSVCEISSTLPNVGACGQAVAQTGYLTKYSYDGLGRLLGVTQNAQPNGTAQSRAFVYDGVGRLTSETNPESATTTYVYDSYPSPGVCGGWTSQPGDLMLVSRANGTSTCYVHNDPLHRLTYSGESASVCKVYRYDNSQGATGTRPAAITSVQNSLGRLVEAETDNCTAWPPTPQTQITDEWFSYSPRGEITDVYESATPSSGNYYHTTASFWATGALETLGGIPGVPTTYYGTNSSQANYLDGEGRYLEVTAASGTTPVTGVTYSTSSTTNPLGALTNVTLGSNDTDAFTYDPNTGRMASYTFSVNGKTDVGKLTWNTNGTLNQLAITDQIPSTSDSQTCNYLYDDLQRLSSANCGALWAQNFAYDAFGNISKSVPSGSNGLTFAPTYAASNQFYSIPGVSVKYDASGNLLTDNLNTYTWDGYNKMATVTPSGGSTVTVTYDALGRAVMNSTGGANTTILYGPTGKKVATLNGQTLLKAEIPLPGGAKAIYNTTGLAYFRHSDWLGSSRLTSTATNPTSMYSSIAYAPFGEQYATAGTVVASFTGQDQDTVKSLYDFPSRRQSPSQGRWISPDPAGRSAVSLSNPQSWNQYAYVNNNPMAMIDPLGLSVRHRNGRAHANEDKNQDPGDDDDDDDDDDDGGGGGSGGCDATVCTTITVTAPPPDDVQTQDSQLNPCTSIFGGVNDNPGDPGFGEAAAETNGETIFPLPGNGYLNGALNAAAVGTGNSVNVGYVVSQINSMYLAGNTSLTLYFFSGSAGLFQQALASPDLNPAAVASISQVYFIEPGGLTGPNVGGLPAETFIGQGALDNLVQATNGGPGGITSYPGGQPITINAPHSFQLAWNTPQVQATVPVSTPCLGENESLPFPGDSGDSDKDTLVAWLDDFIFTGDEADVNQTSCYTAGAEAFRSVRGARQ